MSVRENYSLSFYRVLQKAIAQGPWFIAANSSLIKLKYTNTKSVGFRRKIELKVVSEWMKPVTT